MRTRTPLGVAAAAFIAISGAATAQGGGADDTCELRDRAIRELSARPDEAFDELFTRFGPGWTGGDSTYSVLLPDGRTLWLFSDTFLGFVNPSRTRPGNSPMVNNTLVVQDGEDFVTLHGEIGGIPRAFFAPADPDSWYWLYDAAVEEGEEGGHVLRVFLIRFERAGDGGIWGFRWVDNSLATVSLPGLELVGIQPLPSGHGVSWGAAVTETAAWTYIYGTEDLGDDKYMHLARVPAGRLTDVAAWEYATGAPGAWSQDPAASARLHEGVANEYSVTPLAGGYLLVTMNALETLSPEIMAFRSCNPEGPFGDGVLLYVTPETEEGVIFTYNAHAHPHLTADGELLISYNSNAQNVAWLFADADLYRPRFVRVPVPGLEPEGNGD